MPSFRFCRTDDLQLLTDALNTCYGPHFPDQPELSAAGFKREIKELDVWSSSCMVAMSDEGPIAVVTGAKREAEGETLIHRIAVHPEFLRQGHARHMLESLSHKLSVLGPPLIVAEVPSDQPEVRDLFEACGYQAEGSFADFALDAPLSPPAAAGAVAAATLEELLAANALAPGVPRSWERSEKTLQNLKDQLQGLVIASDERVEAYALYRDLPEEGRREIVALGGSDSSVFLEILIRVACQAGSLAVTVPKVAPEEVSWEVLSGLGFEQQRTYTRYTAVPSSGL